MVEVARTLDLGCGMDKEPGAIGLDSNPRVKPDVLHDLDHVPYPFPDDFFDRVVCRNVIEHVEQPLRVLAELSRISRSGALIELSTPHFSSPDAFTDPTHLHALTSRSFDYLVPGTQLFDLSYGDVTFEKVSILLTFIDLPRGLQRIVPRLANRNLLRYERRWTYLFPAHQMLVKLRVVK